MFAKPAVSILTLRLIFTEFCLQKRKKKKKDGYWQRTWWQMFVGVTLGESVGTVSVL